MISRPYKTMDGNQAAAHVAYTYSEAAAIYPITPSSPMAELVDEWKGNGRKNAFGNSLIVTEMQSEAGAAGAVHGALTAGALATTFTSSQGLLLMLPNIYRIAGELLPGVFHVAARTIATHALSIFGDHSDIYACRQTGAAIWAEAGVQEVMDLSPVAHLSAIEGRIPFINFFDGFRTSHELHKIEVWEDKDLTDMLNQDAVTAFRKNSLHPHHGIIRGSAQNPDIFFQNREACNPFYDALPGIVEGNLQKINKKLGTSYGLFDYYGAPDATHIIIAMGSVCETIREYLEAFSQQKCGLVAVHLYRPFSAKHLLAALPESTQQITVLNRTKEPGALGEPLYLDVLAALQGSPFQNVPIFSGRYGLSSKDTTPAQIGAVYTNKSKQSFTVGIEDDVTHLSLPLDNSIHTAPDSIVSCKFWGLGGDGTVSATKNITKIVGNNTDMTAQGYFEYDSKKSRGLTISHLRFGKNAIRSCYLINRADFVACHNPVYLHKYNMVQEVRDGGTFLLNCYVQETDLDEYLPEAFKAYVAEHNIHLYLIDAMRIGKEVGLNGKISTILQAAFFATSKILPLEQARQLMKDAALQTYGKKGENIVQMNYDAIDKGMDEVFAVRIPEHWRKILASTDNTVPCSGTNIHPGCLDKSLDNPIVNTSKEPLSPPDTPVLLSYVKNIQQPVTDQRGNELPVSAFLPYVDGFTPPGSTAHERRNVTTEIPKWIPENCIQCNLCSYVCPHAVIRPAVMTKEELTAAPKDMESLSMMGMPEYSFAITVSHVDCTGCGACAAVCPGKKGDKALKMCPIMGHKEAQQYFDYGKKLPSKPDVIEKFKPDTVKGSQFNRPLMEFSGACAGCGETPYVKLLTQLFGDRMYIANATGCSSIWANSAPSTAYTVNEQGHGPAWSNSLFEDAAEFGYGMFMAQEVQRAASSTIVGKPTKECTKDAVNQNIATPNTTISMTSTSDVDINNKQEDTIQWIIGGDGWAYDIGFGGLDHVLASGKNINILVLDTEVYSNTGGQASKATPTGSTAKFITGGKTTAKKDLAAIAMTYDNVYVAQIAMGANYAQTVTALMEAAAYPGPSLVIAYCTCISHGLRNGMGTTVHEVKKAVDSGYVNLFRFNPALRDQGKNPLVLDSTEPTLDYESFLADEIRFDVLKRLRPEEADILFSKAAAQAKQRYRRLQKLVTLYNPEEI